MSKLHTSKTITVFAYDDLDNNWDAAKLVPEDNLVDFQQSRNMHVAKFKDETPQSEVQVQEQGRHWHMKCGVLPNTQAAVHKDGCTYCNGIPTMCHRQGALHRYYPCDGAQYAEVIAIVDKLRAACKLPPLDNLVDPMTGTRFNASSELVDASGRALA